MSTSDRPFDALSRRGFLTSLGGAAAAAAGVAALPDLLLARGWGATPLGPAMVLDTYRGLAAMVWPGNDTYSLAQGHAAARPGAIAAGAADAIIPTLDSFVPAPDNLGPNDSYIPLSALVATAINGQALVVNPLAAAGQFDAPFARLTFKDKVATWRAMEDLTPLTQLDTTHTTGVLRFVVCALPSFVHFLAFSEVDVLDPTTRRLRKRPVGWAHTGYLESSLVASNGWDEFKGYYGNQQKASN